VSTLSRLGDLRVGTLFRSSQRQLFVIVRREENVTHVVYQDGPDAGKPNMFAPCASVEVVRKADVFALPLAVQS
jgi:hypothetical protein